MIVTILYMFFTYCSKIDRHGYLVATVPPLLDPLWTYGIKCQSTNQVSKTMIFLIWMDLNKMVQDTILARIKIQDFREYS